MNTCPTGHQSQAIKGSVLWLVATKARVPDIVFLGDTNKLGRLGGEYKDGARHALPPISRENYSWHLGMCLIRSLPSGQSYEDKLIGHFRRKTRVAFSVCCFLHCVLRCGSQLRTVSLLHNPHWPPDPSSRGIFWVAATKLGHHTCTKAPFQEIIGARQKESVNIVPPCPSGCSYEHMLIGLFRRKTGVCVAVSVPGMALGECALGVVLLVKNCLSICYSMGPQMKALLAT